VRQRLGAKGDAILAFVEEVEEFLFGEDGAPSGDIGEILWAKLGKLGDVLAEVDWSQLVTIAVDLLKDWALGSSSMPC
jgi:hypothetical protein